MTTGEYFGDWLKVIDKKELESILDKINPLYAEQAIRPSYSNIFKAFHLCPYNSLKAVFIGQDPYPQPEMATGLLFGNGPEARYLSPSLRLVLNAVTDAIPHSTDIELDYSLESWAHQGILLLNSALTVELGKPMSHTMIWRPFITKLLRNLCVHESGIIYVLFGKQAQTLAPYIDTRFNHLFTSAHPAYYARAGEVMPTGLFRSIHKLIIDKYGEPIEWFKDNGDEIY